MKTYVVLSICLVLGLAVTSQGRHRFRRDSDAEETTLPSDAPADEQTADGNNKDADVKVADPTMDVDDSGMADLETADVASEADEEDALDLPEDHIKTENVDKCDKCLRPEYQVKHENFCGKCLSLGYIDKEEAEQLRVAINCRKCSKPKYRARHQDLCENSCFTEDLSSLDATTTTEPSTTTTEQATTTESDRKDKKDKKKRKKNKKNKNKKHKFSTYMNEDMAAMDAEVTEAEAEAEAEPLLPHVPSDAELGPFGSLLKHIIISNTFAK